MLKLCSAPETMIHHSVGNRQHQPIRRAGRRFCPMLCGFDHAARRLSHEQRRDRAQQARQRGDEERRRQPHRCATKPPTRKLSPRPIGRPSMNSDVARARCSTGNRSPISEIAAGAQLASPTPTPRRTANSCQKLRARPEAAVSRLQRNTPPARMYLRHRAIGEPAERHADEGVEQRERGAERAERRVAQAPLPANLFADRAEDLAVEEVHHVDGEQHRRARRSHPTRREGRPVRRAPVRCGGRRCAGRALPGAVVRGALRGGGRVLHNALRR